MKLVWQLQGGYANLMSEAKVLDKIEETNSIPVQAGTLSGERRIR
jgi:hypothetical protein